MIKLVLFLISFPSLVQANACKVESSHYSSWTEQSSWTEVIEKPSVENPNYEFVTYRNSLGDLKTGSINLGDVLYKTKLDMKFSTSAQRKVFFDRCEKDSIMVLPKTGEALDPETHGSFKVSLSVLPQSFVGNDNGDSLFQPDNYRISLGFGEDSLVKKSIGILMSIEDARKIIYEQAHQKMTEHLQNGYAGEIHIIFDGLPALACDLLKDRVRLFFRHVGERSADKVVKTDVIGKSALEDFYKNIKDDLGKVSSLSLKNLLAGMYWQEMRVESPESTMSSKKVAKTVIEMLLMASNKISGLTSEEIQCSVDKTASYSNSDEYINLFEIKTQNLKQAQGGL